MTDEPMTDEGMAEGGAHDMGGLAGFGPVIAEEHEPVFHARWESRVFAMTLAMGAWRKWSLDATRFARESIPAPHYLAMSYYQIWLTSLVTQMHAAGLVTEEELMSGRAAPGAKETPPFQADRVQAALRRNDSFPPPAADRPMFEIGQRVRTLHTPPMGHTRLPKYARGRVGIVEQLHGTFVFPDTNAHDLGENPQTVYGVRFSAEELWWGQAADPRHSVRLDLWESYLSEA
jgi:nitrile hydratase